MDKSYFIEVLPKYLQGNATKRREMNITAATLSLILLSVIFPSFLKTANKEQNDPSVYQVSRLKKPIKIDGNWDKPQWKNVKEISIDNYMGAIPAFRPSAKAKMMYDNENLYLVFCVEDRYVRCITQDYNGPVSYRCLCRILFFTRHKFTPTDILTLKLTAISIFLISSTSILLDSITWSSMIAHQWYSSSVTLCHRKLILK